MELKVWIDTLIREFPGLLECLKTNSYPASFLTNALGLSPSLTDQLPQALWGYVLVYFLCGLVTVLLRYKKGQRSLNSVVHQINNVILTWCCTLFLPLLVLAAKSCVYILQNEVAAYQGKDDLVRFAGEALFSIFDMVVVLAGVAFTVWIPVSSAIRYLRVHHLGGLPHMILDVGTGPFLLSVMLLSASRGDRRLYLLVLPAIVLLGVVQRGGYIPEEKNLRTETPPPSPTAESAEGAAEENKM
jgi:hypothetical protein